MAAVRAAREADPFSPKAARRFGNFFVETEKEIGRATARQTDRDANRASGRHTVEH